MTVPGFVTHDPEMLSLFWIAITTAAFVLGVGCQIRLRGAVWANPVMIAIALVACVLALTGTTFDAYFAAVEPIHFLLGPATVALAIPLAQFIGHVTRSLVSMCLALVAGSVVSVVTGIVLVRALGGDRLVALSMAPKAVTTPIAIAITQQVGGQPSLTAAFAVCGGIVAAVLGEPLLRRLGISDWRAHGLAAGLAGSGIAAAQVARRDPLAAAFAALGIGLNGLVTALLVPVIRMLVP